MRKTIILLVTLLLLLLQSNAYAETQFSTGHFTINIPEDWYQYETDTLTYFYGMQAGSLDDKILGVREFGVSPISDDALVATYEAHFNEVTGSETCLEEISSGIVEVDGGNKAGYVCFRLDQNGIPETRLSFLYYNNGIMFQALYVTSSPDSICDEFFDLVNSLHYQEEVPITVHHFGSKHVAVKGWEIIEQLGSTCLLVEYEWYHTEDEPIAFMYSFSTEVYQDGVQCYPYIWLDGEEKDTLKIQKNTKLTCYEVFLLSNDTSPVTLYVDEIFDFSDRYEDVIYQFDIAR